MNGTFNPIVTDSTSSVLTCEVTPIGTAGVSISLAADAMFVAHDAAASLSVAYAQPSPSPSVSASASASASASPAPAFNAAVPPRVVVLGEDSLSGTRTLCAGSLPHPLEMASILLVTLP